MATITETQSREQIAAPRIKLRWRLLVSALLVIHLAAVFLPPFDFSTDRSSPLSQGAISLLRPYVEVMYLDHGYFFFAPNPGPSHLVRYKLEFADGREPVIETFPDIDHHWPRLLYHRHFMLAEALHNTYAPPTPPPIIADNATELARWRRGRDLYEAQWKSFEKHLKHKHGADWVTLTRVEHRQPSVYEFGDDRVRIDDKRLYADLREDGGPLSGAESPAADQRPRAVIPESIPESIGPPEVVEAGP